MHENQFTSLSQRVCLSVCKSPQRLHTESRERYIKFLKKFTECHVTIFKQIGSLLAVKLNKSAIA